MLEYSIIKLIESVEIEDVIFDVNAIIAFLASEGPEEEHKGAKKYPTGKPDKNNNSYFIAQLADGSWTGGDIELDPYWVPTCCSVEATEEELRATFKEAIKEYSEE